MTSTIYHIAFALFLKILEFLLLSTRFFSVFGFTVTTNFSEPKNIKMMLYTATSKINIYDVKIENLQSDFEFRTELNPVVKDVLLTVPNPN